MDMHGGLTIVACCEFTVGSEYVVSDCSNATVFVLTIQSLAFVTSTLRADFAQNAFVALFQSQNAQLAHDKNPGKQPGEVRIVRQHRAIAVQRGDLHSVRIRVLYRREWHVIVLRFGGQGLRFGETIHFAARFEDEGAENAVCFAF